MHCCSFSYIIKQKKILLISGPKGAVHLKTTAELANSVKIKEYKNGVSILEKDELLEFIGKGRSAVVFKMKHTNKALKIFSPTCAQIAKEEADIYRVLEGNVYFPRLYEAGDNYLVMDYIQGVTLFDCLTQGIELNELVIQQVDKALLSAKRLGLNPSDIHLKNIILLPEGKIKIIDVARFRQTKDCRQWKDLKKAFFKFYKKNFFPKKIPVFLLNFIVFLYKKVSFSLPVVYTLF